MGQEPNIRLGPEDLPRATPQPAAPRRWSPQRPGEIGSPEEMPWGGAFGTPGPDPGFANRIVGSLDLPGGERNRADVEAVVVAVMTALASAIGRAPVVSDVAVVIDLLELTEANAGSFAGVAHDHARLRAIVAALPIDRSAA